MGKRCLITGGAGFIGSHLADELLANGYEVRVLDNLDPQVHPDGRWPDYLSPEVERVKGDVRNARQVKEALQGVDQVFHFAANVGVGQSMYEIERYTSVNNLGTAVLLQTLITRPVEKLIVASSMSIYGEGRYCDTRGRYYEQVQREIDQLLNGQWEPLQPDGFPLTPVPTPESKQPMLASVYALGKYDQEQLCLISGRAYQFPVVALRFFNVYGPRQALSNPYTGVLAIFASRCLNNRPPVVYEDGLQLRDFVHVLDVARACRLAMEETTAAGEVYNIGSGKSYSVRQIAELVCQILGKSQLQPSLTGQYRVGDIRHCFADISKARAAFGYQPQISLEIGLQDLASWLENQLPTDRHDQAQAELAARGLTL